MNQTPTASIDLAQLDKLEALAPQLRGAARQLRQYLKLAAGTADWSDSQQSSACDEAAGIFESAVLARRSLTSGAPAGPLNKAAIVLLANESGIDTDPDGDIFGSTNGALLKFADSLMSRAALVHDAAAPSAFINDDLDALVREYGNAPVIGSDRTRRVVMQEIYQLAGEIFGEAGAAAKTEQASRDAIRAQSIEDACHAEVRDLRTELAEMTAKYRAELAKRLITEVMKEELTSAAGAGSDQAGYECKCGHSVNVCLATSCEPAELALAPGVTVQDERALPPLPDPDVHTGDEAFGDNVSSFSGAAMRDYARAALAHPVQDGEKDAKGGAK